MKDRATNKVEYQTPCYVFHMKRLEQNIATFRNAFSSAWGPNFAMGYSIKTNHLPWLLKYAKKQGFLAEAVSDEEYHLALACGFEPQKIIFNGPQKGNAALKNALDGRSFINLDGFEDVEIIVNYLKSVKGICPQLKLGLRVNFDLEKMCPGETTAGAQVSRFGFCEENGELGKAIDILRRSGAKISGLHMHYSTVTRSSGVFTALAKKACEVADRYKIAKEIEYLDMGGGFFGGNHFGRYPSPEEYAEQIVFQLKKFFAPEKVCLIIEPGASILATAADYRCKVIGVKQIRDTRVVTTDGTSLHINPFQVKRQPVYAVRHIFEEGPIVSRQVICGNTCMEHDRFFESNADLTFSVGDELIFQLAGAYTMAFNNCFINTPPPVYLFCKNAGEDECLCIRNQHHGLMMKC